MAYSFKEKMEWTIIFATEFGRRFGLTLKQAFSAPSSLLTSTTITATLSRSSRWSVTWPSTATGKEGR